MRAAYWSLAAAAALAGILVGQGMVGRGIKPAPRAKFSGRPWNAVFTDIAARAGLAESIIYGDLQQARYLVETSSGGVAMFDYDGDGWLDLFFAGGTRFEDPPPKGAGNRLYRNQRDGTFKDVTDRAGVRRPGWASGVAAADFDNDGDEDLFVTYRGDNVLWHNNGDGTFTDITAEAGLRDRSGRQFPTWGAGATWLDYDRDGDLDLFVSNYAQLDLARVPKPGENSFCNWKGVPVACGPRGLPTDRHFLYRNDSGVFTDVSAKAGITVRRDSYGMTALAADLDDDGWPDIYVACDSTPSLLYRNHRDGTFTEEGIEWGLALDENGREQAGMGLAIGDYNLDGRLDLFKTHFADDTHILYRNEGKVYFRDVTLEAGLAVETRYVGWGTGLQDFDNDGLPDIFIVTGGVYPDTEKELPAYPYRSPRLLFRNLGDGKFEQIAGMAALTETHSSRGAAFGDFDNDGDIDAAVMNRNEAPSLLRNDLKGANHWLQVRLAGRAIGARVTAVYGGRRQVQEVVSQSSFYSSNDKRLHFGLGNAASADLTVRWPSGRVERYVKVVADQILALKEPGGIVGQAEPAPPRKGAS